MSAPKATLLKRLLFGSMLANNDSAFTKIAWLNEDPNRFQHPQKNSRTTRRVSSGPLISRWFPKLPEAINASSKQFSRRMQDLTTKPSNCLISFRTRCLEGGIVVGKNDVVHYFLFFMGWGERYHTFYLWFYL